MSFRVRSTLHAPDWPFIIVALLLLGFGLLMVYDASTFTALRDFSDSFYFVKLQAVWLGIGLLGALFFIGVDYHLMARLAVLPFFLLLLFLLVLALVAVLPPNLVPAGVSAFIPEINGAHRWLRFSGFNFQPSEALKLVFIFYLASWLVSKGKEALTFRRGFLPFFLLLGLLLGLIVAQPDLGTGLVIVGIGLCMYFAFGGRLSHFLLSLPVVMGSVFAFVSSSDYRRERFLTFLKPETSDPLSSGYHIKQILLALGSGGFFGVGLGQSRGKYAYLPQVYADSIFAVIGEELGFLGALTVLFLFMFLVWRGFQIAKRAQDELGRLLGVGISVWLGLQALFNVASMLALIPLTGVPLPLISYGGSALVFLLFALGVLVNISRSTRLR